MTERVAEYHPQQLLGGGGGACQTKAMEAHYCGCIIEGGLLTQAMKAVTVL